MRLDGVMLSVALKLKLFSGLVECTENGNGTGTESRNGNDLRKMPNEGYDVDTQIRFYSMMLLCSIVGPFCTVPLK